MSSQSRSDRLFKFFNSVVSGKKPVTTVDNVKLFLEAIHDQRSPSACVERIIASPSARSALQQGLRFNVTPAFLNNTTTPFVHYLANPEIKQLCNGQFLQDLLAIVVEPKTLWTAFLQAFRARELTDSSVHALAWMIVEVLSFPASAEIDIKDDAQQVMDDGFLLRSASADIRALGHKIKHNLMVKSTTNTPVNPDFAPGGRHDNDFADFRSIAIYPTADEFASTAKPFYRRMDEISELSSDMRIPVHLDNQFRLLREDMLSELRDDIQIALGKKKGRRNAPLLQKLSVVNIRHGDGRRLRPCSLAISCDQGLERISNIPSADRKRLLNEDRGYQRHDSFGCFIRHEEIVAFATVDRNVDQLLLDPPVIVLRVLGDDAMKKTLMSFKLYDDIQFLLVEASVFAYEPILKCLQDKTDLPLSRELLEFKKGDLAEHSDLISDTTIQDIRNAGDGNIQSILDTKTPVYLDPSQLQSFISGLTQTLSLIQGPPGTGKSFIGALLAKLFHDRSKETILVMCYTNHALDQFLEDLLDIGIDSSSIVRLGSKSTTRTLPLSLSQQKVAYKHTRSTWDVINKYENEANIAKGSLTSAMNEYTKFKGNSRAMLEFLEFEHPTFYDAFLPPSFDDDMTMVGENGRIVDSHYLYDQWSRGKQPGFFMDGLSEDSRLVWAMDPATRQTHIREWTHSLLEEQVSNIHQHTREIDRCQNHLDKVWKKGASSILQSKRIIGCTTTAAAMNAQDLQSASPGIVLLEEAGEILESHVLTAMGTKTKHLVLIGDHQQLRPKINNYALSVEKGNGYDLNCSLFERLVLAGYPHSTLAKQHRMCPEISSLVRALNYPDLQDDAKTLGRVPPRGLQDRVIFFHHEQPETKFMSISDRRDEGSKGSKRNIFEVEIVLKIVRYLGQQGYGTDKLVVLTPYLGQLHLLRDFLRKDSDPVLSDLDSYDLVRAGLISQASANYSKRSIRLSTIDNYQGEESDIVIATLTRSNGDGDIGFMAAPQRLNVLLSRARNILIMVGNANTFTISRKGKEVWVPFIDNLKTKGHLYDGLPVKCEQHPQKMTVVRTAAEFDTECPDGGCALPCGVRLSCGIHDCPYRCHQLSDHSKMECRQIIEWVCSRGHRTTRPCAKINGACQPCNAEDRAQEAKKQRNMMLEVERERRQKEYMKELTELQDEIAHERRLQKDEQDREQRKRVLQQHRDDLANLRSPKPDNQSKAMNMATETITPKQSPAFNKENDVPSSLKPEPTVKNQGKSTNKPEPPKSAAKDEWEYQKNFEGAKSAEIDTLMEMIGLEEVKEKFITIKDQVDTTLKQGIDLKGERFGSVLRGNPGTGKTTFARLYSKFLGAVGVLPGSCFVETTGSELANEGVSGCQKKIEGILKDGGGVMFIDEAYQLAENNIYGIQVINFLLGEVEKQTGKVVFVLAGYRSHMEKFFEQNPGLPSRFPHEFKFEDYDDDELRQIFEYRLDKKYNGRMKIEGGRGGLFSRIVARRVGRGRGKEGFGNARAIENVTSLISQRQANRLARERRSRRSVDVMFLTKNDLIGPEPSQALRNCSAWQKLKKMIGLDAVKKDVQALLDSIQTNYERELLEKKLVEFTLNRVFLGSPGTGKTSVAKLYGQILVDIGLLSNGEVIVKNPADFVGSVLGESERNTKGILASTVGKVLVIDEAYMLSGGGSRDDSGPKSDPYKTAVVDTIVSEVHSVPGDDRCVLLLGYQEQMEEMFRNVNPGLTRRFPLDSAFMFEDFTDDELGLILDLKLEQQDFETTTHGRKVALEVLARARNRANFGNAGEVDILLNKAKIRHQKRVSARKASTTASVLVPEDFDEHHDRGQRTETNIPMLFADVVGSEKIVEQLEGYRRTVMNMQLLDLDPRDQVAFNFLFRGPPGTGKTTTARKMGKVYYDMGLLASAEVIESSATDLIGQYVGKTGPKTQALLEKALGKVLLIDEAYRLAEGAFAKEAMDEIVDCITKPKFEKKLIIILAGYDGDINRLMTINPGLTSRFPHSMEFNGLNPDDCFKLLTNLLQGRRKKVHEKGKEFDISALEGPTSQFANEVRSRFSILSQIPNWANARDVQTLAKAIFGKTMQSVIGTRLAVEEKNILAEMDSMITDRTNRSNVTPSLPPINLQPVAVDDQTATPTETKTSTTTTMAMRQKSPERQESLPEPKVPEASDGRDAGVTNEIWNQLLDDKRRAELEEEEYQQALKDEREAEEATRKLAEETRAAEKQRHDDDEAKRRHEQDRLQRELERRIREEKLERLRRKKAEMEAERKKEQQAQQKLRDMGVCCMGYRWIKQSNGYRCAGGSHFVSNAQLGF